MRRAEAIVLLLAAMAGACQSRPPKFVVGVGTDTRTYAAVKLAAQEINAAGGIAGVPLELVGQEESTRSYSPEAVVEMAMRFSAVPHLVAVIGHGDSAATLTAAPVYNRNGIPHIVAIATNPGVTNIGPWTYRVCLSDAVQGPALAEYAVRRWKKTKLAIVYVNDDYGRGLARLFEERALSLGAQIVVAAMHRNTLTEDDHEAIRDAIREMKQAGTELVVLFQRVAAAGWTVEAIREAGLQADILGAEDLAQNSFPRLAGASADGVRVSQFVNLDPADRRVAGFAGAIRAATGEDAEASQALAYDAMYLLRDALAGGGYTRAGIKSYLDRAVEERRRFDGVAGPFTFGEDHDARRPFFIAELRGGLFRIIEPLPAR